MTYISEPVDIPLTGAESFDSGVPSLDDWLRSTSVTMEKANMGRTFVWRDGEAVVAYYHLAPHELGQEGIPSRDRFAKKNRPVPSFLIAKLALSKTLQGRGLGAALLYDALVRIVAAASQVGGRLVIVDAIDERAAGFYGAHGFKEVRVEHPDRPRRFFRSISSIVEDMDESA